MYFNHKASKFAFYALFITIHLLFAKSAISAPETPLQIYQYSISSDPTLGAATSARQARIENTEEARGRLYPEIDLTADVTSNREEVQTSGVGTSGITNFSSNSVELRLSQPLYRKDISSKIDIADAESQVAESELKLARQNLIMRVIAAYFDVLSKQDSLAFSDAEKQAIYSQLQIVKQRYKVGKSTLTDLQEARASYALSEAQLITAEDNNIDSLEGLTQLTGRQHFKVASLSPSFIPDRLEHEELDYWINLAESNNPQLLAARQSIKALKHDIELKSAGRYPKLDLVAKYSKEETGGRFGDSETDDASIGLELVIPIYNGGQIRSKVRSANLELSEARYSLIKTHRAVIREIRKSHRTVKTSLNRINARKRAVESADTALTMIRKGYQVGTRTSTDVLDAQREVFLAQRDYLADKYNYIINYLQLRHHTGTLLQDDLEMINKWF